MTIDGRQIGFLYLTVLLANTLLMLAFVGTCGDQAGIMLSFQETNIFDNNNLSLCFDQLADPSLVNQDEITCNYTLQRKSNGTPFWAA